MTVGDDSFPAGRWALDVDRGLLGARLAALHQHELRDEDDATWLVNFGYLW